MKPAEFGGTMKSIVFKDTDFVNNKYVNIPAISVFQFYYNYMSPRPYNETNQYSASWNFSNVKFPTNTKFVGILYNNYYISLGIDMSYSGDTGVAIRQPYFSSDKHISGISSMCFYKENDSIIIATWLPPDTPLTLFYI